MLIKNFINLTWKKENIANFYVYIKDFILKISSHLFFSIKERSIFVIVLCVQFNIEHKNRNRIIFRISNARNREEWSVIKKTRFSQNNFFQKTFAR